MRNYKEITINNTKYRIHRIFKNGRCAIGQTPGADFVVYVRQTKEFRVFRSFEGDKLNKFLVDNGLVGSILYQGTREDYKIRLMELPERGYALKWNDEITYYDNTDEDREELVQDLIGVFGFSPNSATDNRVLEHIRFYYEEHL